MSPVTAVAKPIKDAENTENFQLLVNLPEAGKTGKSRDVVAERLGISDSI